jgi:hypothetical protein
VDGSVRSGGFMEGNGRTGVFDVSWCFPAGPPANRVVNVVLAQGMAGPCWWAAPHRKKIPYIIFYSPSHPPLQDPQIHIKIYKKTFY